MGLQAVEKLIDSRLKSVTSEQWQASRDWRDLDLVRKLLVLQRNPFVLKQILSKAPEGCPIMAVLDREPGLPAAGQVGICYVCSTCTVLSTTLLWHSARPVVISAAGRGVLAHCLHPFLHNLELLILALSMYRLTGTLVTHSALAPAPTSPDRCTW